MRSRTLETALQPTPTPERKAANEGEVQGHRHGPLRVHRFAGGVRARGLRRVVRTAIDLFSGAAGGWTLGLHRAGVQTLAACERDPWRRAAYAARWSIPIYDDIRTLTAARLSADGIRSPWLLCGSPPCQDASEANHRGRGIDGEQTGLFREAIRLAIELRPVWVALENVRRLRDRGADRVLATLAEAGYAAWPIVVGVGAAGAAHRRERVWIVALDAARREGRLAGQSRVGCGLDAFAAGDGQHAEPVDGEVARLVGPRNPAGWEAAALDPERGLGPAGSQPLGRHLRAYAGVSPRLAEHCRAAYGDAVSPIIPELIARALIAWEDGAVAAAMRTAA